MYCMDKIVKVEINMSVTSSIILYNYGKACIIVLIIKRYSVKYACLS